MKKYVQMMLVFVLCLAALPLAVPFMLEAADRLPTSSDMQESNNNYSNSGGMQEQFDPSEVTNITIYDVKTGKYVDLETEVYVTGALYSAMPASFGTEALKAQATVIRSLVYYRTATGTHCPLHGDALFCTDPGCCLGYTDYDNAASDVSQDVADFTYAEVKTAVEMTKGVYIAYGSMPAMALFHASSCGRTESMEAVTGEVIPYLISVDTPDESSLPGFETTLTLSPSELLERLGIPQGTEEINVQVIANESGRASGVSIAGTLISGRDFAESLSLPSTNVTIIPAGEKYAITSRGIGSGLGMSQYGASVLSSEGYTYYEILSHYYPGTVFKNA